ncbi:unnamed protein product [Boreogadus saida]
MGNGQLTEVVGTGRVPPHGVRVRGEGKGWNEFRETVLSVSDKGPSSNKEPVPTQQSSASGSCLCIAVNRRRCGTRPENFPGAVTTQSDLSLQKAAQHVDNGPVAALMEAGDLCSAILLPPGTAREPVRHTHAGGAKPGRSEGELSEVLKHRGQLWEAAAPSPTSPTSLHILRQAFTGRLTRSSARHKQIKPGSVRQYAERNSELLLQVGEASTALKSAAAQPALR